MKNTISLNLDTKRDDHESLGELLEQAVTIASPMRAEIGERCLRDEMRWILRTIFDRRLYGKPEPLDAPYDRCAKK